METALKEQHLPNSKISMVGNGKGIQWINSRYANDTICIAYRNGLTQPMVLLK